MGWIIGLAVIGSIIRALGRGRGGRYLTNRYAHKALAKTLRGVRR